MVTADESKITKIVAVYENRFILPPCGRCRVLLSRIKNPDINKVFNRNIIRRFVNFCFLHVLYQILQHQRCIGYPIGAVP